MPLGHQTYPEQEWVGVCLGSVEGYRVFRFRFCAGKVLFVPGGVSNFTHTSSLAESKWGRLFSLNVFCTGQDPKDLFIRCRTNSLSHYPICLYHVQVLKRTTRNGIFIAQELMSSLCILQTPGRAENRRLGLCLDYSLAQW